VNEVVEEFLTKYIKPQAEKSQIVQIRKKIRGSTKLNYLLYDNRKGLTRLFNEFKNKKTGRFTFDSARNLLQIINEGH